jgi:hypothetical protein
MFAKGAEAQNRSLIQAFGFDFDGMANTIQIHKRHDATCHFCAQFSIFGNFRQLDIVPFTGHQWPDCVGRGEVSESAINWKKSFHSVCRLLMWSMIAFV